METYLPVIKALLSEWYLFTLNNPLYAGVLATVVWLLTATLYSIRLASLKRKKAASEKAGFESLNAMQQQLQQSQESLAETVEQMEKAQRAAQDETQRALALEQLIYQRNQQVAGTVQTLATSFDLGERPLLASEDVKADSLWQQHDKVIMQLIERLRTEQQAKTELQQTYQAETAKLAEKEVLLNTLQSTLNNHTSQLSKLEQALEEQKSMLQQQNNSQRALSDTLKNFQPVVTQPIAPKPETFTAVKDWQQPIQAAENPPVIEEPQIAQPEPTKPVEQISVAPEAAATHQVEQTPIESAPAFEEIENLDLDLVLDENMQPVTKETPATASDLDQQAAASSKESFGKVKGLFGKKQSSEPDVESQPATPSKGSLGKIKNLFGKKEQTVKTEPQWTDAEPDETVPPTPIEERADTVQQSDDVKAPGKLKGFYSKFRSKDK